VYATAIRQGTDRRAHTGTFWPHGTSARGRSAHTRATARFCDHMAWFGARHPGRTGISCVPRALRCDAQSNFCPFNSRATVPKQFRFGFSSSVEPSERRRLRNPSIQSPRGRRYGQPKGRPAAALLSGGPNVAVSTLYSPRNSAFSCEAPSGCTVCDSCNVLFAGRTVTSGTSLTGTCTPNRPPGSLALPREVRAHDSERHTGHRRTCDRAPSP
jgi:hypothetical protein